MKKRISFTGLIAAAHTPFKADGALNLKAVERQAEHLARNGLSGVFVGGSTGESHSLTVPERLALSERWAAVLKGSAMPLIVHVGHNCTSDAATLAAQAERLGAAAISALAPSYFKPGNVTRLIECFAPVVRAAPRTPFYYYDIPSMTGVSLPVPAFLAEARRWLPTLAGIKYTCADLMQMQECMRADGGRWDILFGVDEHLLAGLALGARGAVGSSYNFAAPLYLRLIRAFEAGDLAAAREQQWRSVRLIRTLASLGYMGAAKAVMGMLGVDVGPARAPNGNPSPAQRRQLRKDLEALGFFGWIRGG
ncbi:MAG: N-acetylneuraminate lyase [Lentisphaerae bacterium]|nr:N-acetylneuraminate lyase [Lentisphaerota bacterium]